MMIQSNASVYKLKHLKSIFGPIYSYYSMTALIFRVAGNKFLYHLIPCETFLLTSLFIQAFFRSHLRVPLYTYSIIALHLPISETLMTTLSTLQVYLHHDPIASRSPPAAPACPLSHL